MNITIADIKAIMKRKMYSYANCNLSKDNPYYVNSGAIQLAEDWFKDFAQIKNLPEKQIMSINQHLKTLRNKYLFS